jgi:membrane protein involved in colicin uptake
VKEEALRKSQKAAKVEAAKAKKDAEKEAKELSSASNTSDSFASLASGGGGWSSGWEEVAYYEAEETGKARLDAIKREKLRLSEVKRR